MNYQRIYDSIVNRAKSEGRVKSKDTYYEAHHIIPSCLGGTGLTTQWKTHPNIVLLTGREHFLCHWLLHEIYPDNHKLAKAFFMMCTVKDSIQSRYTPSSRIIEYAKHKFIDAQRNMSQETKDKMSLAKKGKPAHNKGVPMKQEQKDKLSLHMKNNGHGENNPFCKKKHSQETIDKCRQAAIKQAEKRRAMKDITPLIYND